MIFFFFPALPVSLCCMNKAALLSPLFLLIYQAAGRRGFPLGETNNIGVNIPSVVVAHHFPDMLEMGLSKQEDLPFHFLCLWWWCWGDPLMQHEGRRRKSPEVIKGPLSSQRQSDPNVQTLRILYVCDLNCNKGAI